MRKCRCSSKHHTQGGPRRLWLRRDRHQQASISGDASDGFGGGTGRGTVAESGQMSGGFSGGERTTDFCVPACL
ncbi:hypothetical protein L195_g009427 [Trifolium pratense]|uniref:Uncharacterized protein n=1 Tax=Trifolium pratense TaxID=57577 RepID=A0A2K3PBW2_TRIPR|nr:hypothetical protein L195_g009427 [Trifolium pratense]